MQVDFVLFGPRHLLILGAFPAAAALLTWLSRQRPASTRAIRLGLGVFLVVNELIWLIYRLKTEGVRFPEGLPLELCDLALWMTILTAFTLRTWSLEVAYFAGIGGSSMAMLTPDLWAPFLSYPTMYFFLAHGGVVMTILFLLWSRSARPRSGCVWRAFAILNIYTALIGAFNAFFGTNYMYLCQKPLNISLLDYFGPWPVYIIVGEVFALLAFQLLWLPFRAKQNTAPAVY